jgi:broad specificity phosphatase PhoE
MLRIVLLRHGQTAWNQEGKNQGSEDIELDAIGRIQSEQTATRLSGRTWNAAFTSPLRRARETAEIVLRGQSVLLREDDRLRERSYGAWEGKTAEEIGPPYEEYRRDRVLYRPPGGETGLEVFMRAAAFLHDLLEECTGDVLVVSHGGTTAALIAVLLHGTPATAATLRLANCSITEIHITADRRRVLGVYNDTSHLDPQPIPVVSHETAPTS